jgi:hypothetical protein
MTPVGFAPAARFYELIEGDVVSGTVIRLPMACAHAGTRLFLRTDTEVIAIPATAGKGHTVLQKLLEERQVAVGDHLAINHRGKRSTLDGLRQYCHYEIEVTRAS